MEYNQDKGGVDKSDQCLSYYPTIRNQQQNCYLKNWAFNKSKCVKCIYSLKKGSGEMTH